MQYIIVESISAFNYAKKKIKKTDICWVSSSPKVCNFFFINKVNFLEIEKLVNEKELNEIEKISKYMCNLIIEESNKIFEKKKIYRSKVYCWNGNIQKNLFNFLQNLPIK